MLAQFKIDTPVYKKGDRVRVTALQGNELLKEGVADLLPETEIEWNDAATDIKDRHILDGGSTGLGNQKRVDDKNSALNMGVSEKGWEKYRGKDLSKKESKKIAEYYGDKDNILFKDKPSTEFKQAAKIFSGKIALAERFYEFQPIYYDEIGLWWLWNFKLKCWEKTDETNICNQLVDSLNIDTINAKERSEIFQALKQVGRKRRPTPMPNTWIQFKDKIFDITNGEEFEADYNYFTVNPIPYSLHKEKYIETPNMDRIFKEWVGEKYVKTLYEIIAYCCLADYPIHRLFCFIGSGMNGKSKYLQLIEKFIGQNNICSTELDTLLSSRFEVTRLHKKLVCQMGETNFNELSKTSILKKLTGQDMIGYEYKNKTPFEEHNYAKILISTNNLPETTDKTIGFYRRWLIIDFPNQFTEEKDILADIPEEEFNSLATKCATIIIPELLKNRKFSNEGDINERQKTYEEKSNPFDKFFNEMIEIDHNSFIHCWEFEKNFNEWCIQNRFRKVSEKFIVSRMREKGIEQIKPRVTIYDKNESKFVDRQIRSWEGIKWKQ